MGSVGSIENPFTQMFSKVGVYDLGIYVLERCVQFIVCVNQICPVVRAELSSGSSNGKKRRNALIKLEVSMHSTNSMWMALMARQVKITAQRLL